MNILPLWEQAFRTAQANHQTIGHLPSRSFLLGLVSCFYFMGLAKLVN